MLSSEAHATIISIETAEAMAIDGVHSIVTAEDVPGENAIGAVVRDEEVFARKTVHCIGYPVAMVLATTQVCMFN